MHPSFDYSSRYSQPSNWVQAIILRTADHFPTLDLSILSSQEHARYKAFINPYHQQDFALAHILKRQVLSQYLKFDKPSNLQFSVNAMGKPFLIGHKLHFNLSHSRGIVALVFSNNLACGIDVEAHQTNTISRTLIQASMSHAEQSAIQSSKFPVADFFDRWVIKEALVKAQGVGLRQPFSEICTFDKHYPQFNSEQNIAHDQLWHMEAQDYSLAICALGKKPAFIVEYPPLLSAP